MYKSKAKMNRLLNIRNFLFIGILFLLFSCNRNNQHPVPYLQFDVNLNLNLPSYQPLQGVGGYAYVSGAGSKGVIVYRRSSNEFVAFDRHSPADTEGTCPSGLETDDENFLVLNDPCSDAQFSLYDGSIYSGDVEWGLRSYTTHYNGGDYLRVYNP